MVLKRLSHFLNVISTMPEVFASEGESGSGLTLVTAGDRDSSVYMVQMVQSCSYVQKESKDISHL